MQCTGAGQCVECTEDGDCSSLTKDCKVGKCTQYKCAAGDATTGKGCTAQNGKPGKCASGGVCECTPQCNKPCGADGCGDMCPNTCGSLMCVSDACVECTRDTQCEGTDCKAGVCSGNGRCTQSASARQGAACKIGGLPGTCNAGECECKSDCGSQHCSTDSCGRPCNYTCSQGMECKDNTCRSKPVVSAPARCPCPSSLICDATLNLCTTYCGSDADCAGTGMPCFGGTECALTPPCPGGMTTVTFNGRQACGYKANP